MLLALGIIICVLLAGAVITSYWARRSYLNSAPSQHGSLVGVQGVAQSTFLEDGMVLVHGELWKAESRSGIIEKGASVEVVEMLPGLKVVVTRIEVKPGKE